MKIQINPNKKYKNTKQHDVDTQHQAKMSLNFFMRTGFMMDPIPSISARKDDKHTIAGHSMHFPAKSIKATNLVEFAAQLANS